MSDYTHEIVQAIGFLSSEMTETRCQLRQALQDISDALNVPTPKRVRNESACCGNCPYAYKSKALDGALYCRKTLHVSAQQIYSSAWCGDHPDFWKES